MLVLPNELFKGLLQVQIKCENYERKSYGYTRDDVRATSYNAYRNMRWRQEMHHKTNGKEMVQKQKTMSAEFTKMPT